MTDQFRTIASMQLFRGNIEHGQEQHGDRHSHCPLEKCLTELRADTPQDRRVLRANAHIILAALDLLEAEDGPDGKEDSEDNG